MKNLLIKSSHENISKELLVNLNNNDAIVIVSSTETTKGRMIRYYINEDKKVAESLCKFAMKTGAISDTLEFLDRLEDVIIASREMIENELEDRSVNN